MVQENRLNKVVIITGPTAVGKTEISLKIAKAFNTEIINADASQFRKDLNIGTAKIDLSKTTVIHHLIDILNPTDSFSIKDFQDIGREEIRKFTENNKLPLVVGGSGLYISALVGDYDLTSNGRYEENDDKYKDLSNIELYEKLKDLDYETSLLVHPNNRRRVLRYLELIESGEKVTDKTNGKNLIYDALIIVLDAPRKVLYERINKRVEIMIENGWIDEVKSLINNNVDISKIKEIGYKEIAAYLNNEVSYQDMLENIKKDVRHYAKRQLTWFRNKLDCKFITMNYENEEETLHNVHGLIESFIK